MVRLATISAQPLCSEALKQAHANLNPILERVDANVAVKPNLPGSTAEAGASPRDPWLCSS